MHFRENRHEYGSAHTNHQIHQAKPSLKGHRLGTGFSSCFRVSSFFRVLACKVRLAVLGAIETANNTHKHAVGF